MKRFFEFRTPSSIDEAETRSIELKKSIMTIELQLTERKIIRCAQNRMMSPAEYNNWRVKALFNLASMRAEVMELTKWTKDRRRERQAALFDIEDPNDATQVLRAARSTLLRTKNSDRLSDRERANLGRLADVIDQHLFTAA